MQFLFYFPMNSIPQRVYGCCLLNTNDSDRQIRNRLRPRIAIHHCYPPLLRHPGTNSVCVNILITHRHVSSAEVQQQTRFPARKPRFAGYWRQTPDGQPSKCSLWSSRSKLDPMDFAQFIKMKFWELWPSFQRSFGHGKSVMRNSMDRASCKERPLKEPEKFPEETTQVL